jgi:cobalamin-dependent methionine synthase I
MTVVKDIPLHLDIEEILRREGFTGKRDIRPAIKRLILELHEEVEKGNLLHPAVAYGIYPADEIEKKQLSMKDNGDMHGRLLTSVIPEAQEIAVVVCTIGPELEEKVTHYSKSGDVMHGMLLDGIGSSAVDSLCHEAGYIIAGEVSPRGYHISSPITPGMPCLPITEQTWLLELIHSQDIGVSLSSSNMMIPRKSTSMVIGIGHEMETWTQAELCGRCNLRDTCSYKYVNA